MWNANVRSRSSMCVCAVCNWSCCVQCAVCTHVCNMQGMCSVCGKCCMTEALNKEIVSGVMCRRVSPELFSRSSVYLCKSGVSPCLNQIPSIFNYHTITLKRRYQCKPISILMNETLPAKIFQTKYSKNVFVSGDPTETCTWNLPTTANFFWHFFIS